MGRWIERSLLLVALVCLAIPAAAWLDAACYQSTLNHRLDRLLATASAGTMLSGARAEIAADPGVGLDGLVGRIEVPRLGLTAIVVEGVDARTLRRAVGHYPGSALPGHSGNVVLAGHRDSFFRSLHDVATGDIVRVTTPRGVFDYEVDEVSIVPPDRVDLLSPSAAPTLTLITCYPFHSIGPAPRRFIVRARPTSDFLNRLS